MFENHYIQTRGFRNTVDKDGSIVGFELRVRTKYYSGLWLAKLRIADLVVDGEVYPPEAQTWVINGTAYTPDEMLELGDHIESTYWQVLDTAIVRVRKPGGLSQGYHKLSITFGWQCNYATVKLRNPVTGVTMGTFPEERTLLIV